MTSQIITWMNSSSSRSRAVRRGQRANAIANAIGSSASWTSGVRIQWIAAAPCTSASQTSPIRGL